jgi:uncharacterized protein YndB with AHSA1/START domain
MKETRIDLERTYAHPIDAVWSAISEASEISKWFIDADFKPEVGYSYTFTHEDTQIVGEVLAVDPPTELVYTWCVKGTGIVTTVRWALTSTGAGTEVKLEHTGFDEYGESAIGLFTSFQKGWASCADELEKHLAEAIATV